MANLTHLYVSSRMTDGVRDLGDRFSHRVNIYESFPPRRPTLVWQSADYSRKNPTDQVYCRTAAERLLGTDKEQNYVVAPGNINTLASNVSIYVCVLGTATCYMVKCRVDSDISFKVHQYSTTTISHTVLSQQVLPSTNASDQCRAQKSNRGEALDMQPQRRFWT